MQIILAGKILERNVELADASPLKEVFDMTDFETVMKSSDEHNTKRNDFKQLAENETELRDHEWAGAVTVIRQMAQFLKSFYVDNPHELGKWGFEVDSSPQTKKE